MGKVLGSFRNGNVGAISRSLDDVVIGLANQDSQSLPFGTAVVLTPDATGAMKFSATSTAADFVGFTVRSASKTPDSYGSNRGSYASGEIMDVLVRGSIVVEVNDGTPAPGGKVYLVKASGAVSANSGENKVELTNVRFRTPMDGASRAEVVLLTRNTQ